MIDSHAHIYCEEFDADREAVVRRAQEAGVSHIVMPNENMASLPRQEALYKSHPDYVSMTIGLHPEEVHEDFRQVLDEMHQLLHSHHFVAVGEMGIDLYWDQTMREQQLEALDTQLHWCKEANLPFIMHCRNALQECLSVMDNFGESLPSGVFHSFTGTVEDVEQVRRRGDFYFGVNGIVTFKKSDTPALLPIVGIDRILLETDSPYLSPVPHRGKRNESAHIPHICNCIASHLDLTPQEVSNATDRNALNLFHLNLTV